MCQPGYLCNARDAGVFCERQISFLTDTKTHTSLEELSCAFGPSRYIMKAWEPYVSASGVVHISPSMGKLHAAKFGQSLPSPLPLGARDKMLLIA